MKTTLLIMAAGIGSRFGGGIKQLEPVGLHDEIIMDYESCAMNNADNYYGKEAFQQLHDWLVLEHADSDIAMAGFILKNTLSENGDLSTRKTKNGL